VRSSLSPSFSAVRPHMCALRSAQSIERPKNPSAISHGETARRPCRGLMPHPGADHSEKRPASHLPSDIVEDLGPPVKLVEHHLRRRLVVFRCLPGARVGEVLVVTGEGNAVTDRVRLELAEDLPQMLDGRQAARGARRRVAGSCSGRTRHPPPTGTPRRVSPRSLPSVETWTPRCDHDERDSPPRLGPPPRSPTPRRRRPLRRRTHRGPARRAGRRPSDRGDGRGRGAHRVRGDTRPLGLLPAPARNRAAARLAARGAAARRPGRPHGHLHRRPGARRQHLAAAPVQRADAHLAVRVRGETGCGAGCRCRMVTP
jgi:hypothetical protein